MKTSSLQLEGYHVASLSFNLRELGEIALKTVPNMQPRLEEPIVEAPLTIDVSVNYGWKTGVPSRYRIDLTVQSRLPEDSKFPYDFKVRLVGFFRSAVVGVSGEIDSFVKTNGLSVLYSLAREIITATTSRGPYPGALLPVISFVGSPLVATGPGSQEAAHKQPEKRGAEIVPKRRRAAVPKRRRL